MGIYKIKVGIIGGSGLEDIANHILESATEIKPVELKNDFGEPSGAIHSGILHGVEVALLSSHIWPQNSIQSYMTVYDSDRDVWCNIEEDDEVPDKVDINVIFASSTTELILPLSSIDILLSVQSSTSRQDGTMAADINVIYTEPVNNKSNVKKMKLIIDTDKENKTQMDIDNAISDTDDGVSKSEPATPASSKLPSTSTSNPGPRVLTSLPTLTFDLEKKLEKKSVVEVGNDLMYHWGSSLWNSTNGAPSKQQYRDFASTIVRNYPVFVSADGDSVIVRRTLSTWIRNHRYALKQKIMISDAKEKKHLLHLVLL